MVMVSCIEAVGGKHYLLYSLGLRIDIVKIGELGSRCIGKFGLRMIASSQEIVPDWQWCVRALVPVDSGVVNCGR